ncbi:MAG: metal ABC transporter permease [Pseudomonadota bacterium]
MLDDFLVRAGLAALGVSIAACPLGCFIVWRRMAYFGDAIAHAAVLGVAMALVLAVSTVAGVLFVTAAMAFMVSSLSGRTFAMDTLLGVTAHAGLAFGLVALALTNQRTLNVEAFLFGEILAVNRTDLAVIWGGALLIVALLTWRWRALLTSTLSHELAYASDIDPKRERLTLTLGLAIVVSLALKVVGVLLITSLLIIPAAAARPLVKTPEAMALTAVLIGAMSTLGGLRLSYVMDIPTAPSMVVIATLVFFATNIFAFLAGRRA